MAYERRETVRRVPEIEQRETRYEAAEVEHDQVQAVAYDRYQNRRNAAEKLMAAVYMVFGIIIGLLIIRFVLRALGANPQADFAQFIYGITDVFVAPFVGLFGTPQAGAAVLELTTLVALVVYALLAWLVAKIVWLLVGETRSEVRSASTHVDTRVR